jgi:uncharacterized membrane protein YdjX (TVP38/TMEM64 family)
LCIGAGFAFKRAYLEFQYTMVVGSITCTGGAMVGAIITFLLGRYVFQTAALRLYQRYPVMNAIDKAIETEGLFLVFLLRLCPLLPFSIFNFIIGITSLSFGDFMIGLLGIIPATVGYVFLGTTLSDIEEATNNPEWQNSTWVLVFVIVGVLIMLVGFIWVTIVARRHLERAV